MEKGFSADWISAQRNIDEICQKIKISKSNFRPIRDLRGKKQRKPNMIRSEDKNWVRSKEGRRQSADQNSK